MAVPVHLIAGFLGTGKTTTLLAILADRPPDERVAVIVNDFGQARIDEGTLADSGRLRISEIAGACVCCTAPEGFAGALDQLLDDVRPDRILIEPTGLARPSDLVDTLRRGPRANDLDLRPTIVLVDPEALDGEAVREQAEAADVLVANRADLASPEALSRFDAFAASLWPGPLRTLRAVRGELPPDVLDWPEGSGPRRRGDPTPRREIAEAEHVHGHRVRSWVFGDDAVFSKVRLASLLGWLREGGAGAVPARLKGLFRTDQGTLLLEIAGGRLHERPSPARRESRLDVILPDGDPAAFDRVDAGLAQALLSDDEKAVDASRLELVRPDGTSTRLGRDELRALPGGVPDVAPLVPGRKGAAARLRALLDAAGGAADATEAVVVAADGYVTPPVPLEVLREGLLVHDLDGVPLAPTQGGPFRLLVPEERAPAGPCSNVKGVVRIVLRAG